MRSSLSSIGNAAVVGIIFTTALGGCAGSGGGSSPTRKPAPAPAVVVYEEDFTTNRGWLTNVPNDFTIDTAAGLMRWHADRDVRQWMHLVIPPIAGGDLTVEVVGTIDFAQNNSHLSVGLGAGDVQYGPGFEPPGLYTHLAYFGGGCTNDYYFVRGLLVSENGAEPTQLWGGHVCNQFKGNAIEVLPGQKVRAVLQLRGQTFFQEVFDATSGDALGSSIRTILAPAPSAYDRLIISNYQTGDWPTADGTIDSIRITRP
jgi:hypothetical protein